MRYYEGLDYDRLDMTSQHERARRSSSQSVKLEFRAHGRSVLLTGCDAGGVDEGVFVCVTATFVGCVVVHSYMLHVMSCHILGMLT